MAINVSPPVNTVIRQPDPEAPVTLDNWDQLREYLRKRLHAPTCFVREKHPEDDYHELILASMTAPCNFLHTDMFTHIRHIEDYLNRVDPELPNRDIMMERAKHFVDTLYIMQRLIRLEREYLES